MTRTERVLAWFAGRRARRAVMALALLLSSGSLWLSLAADDHFLYLALARSAEPRGVQRQAWDLFSFAKDSPGVAALMEEGVFPWWSDTSARIAFFRPLSSLTHWLDQRLWPGQSALMHLHSLAWFAALLGVVSALYTRLCRAGPAAGLAFALFALDDARAYTIAWVCNRNGLVALVFGFLALLAHDRARRDGDRAARWLAPPCLAVGLFAGETALQVVAYLFSYALFLDPGTRRVRARSLLPYAGVLIAWRALYTGLGFGAFGSGLYIDPGRDPLAFGQAIMERLPILLAAQYAGVISELTDGLPVLAPRVSLLYLPACALLALGVHALFWPLLRRHAELRFWLLGSLLATLPVCGVSPSDRVLTATAVGASAALASLLVSTLGARSPRATAEGPPPRRWQRAAAWSLAAVNLAVAPLLLPVRIAGVDRVEDILARADGSIASDPSTAHKTLILLNPPLDPLAVFFPLYRVAHGVRRHARTRWLATGVSDLTLERVDPQTLRLTPRAGFLSNSSQWMLRDPRRPPRVGERVALKGVEFEVEGQNGAGLPARVLVRFDRPLEHPSFEWKRWDVHGYVSFAPPALGRPLHVPAVDLLRALF